MEKCKIDVMKKYKVFSLDVVNVEKGEEVFLKQFQRKKYIDISGELSHKSFLIIPNPNFNRGLNIKGNYYFFHCRFKTKNKFSFEYNFTYLNHDIIFSFKYPLNETKFEVKVNKVLIEIPIQVKNSVSSIGIAERKIKFSPREFLSSNSSKLNFKVEDHSNIYLRYIVIYPKVQVFGIYVDKEIDFAQNYRQKIEKEKQIKIIENHQEDTDKLQSDNQKNSTIPFDNRKEIKAISEKSVESEKDQSNHSEDFIDMESIVNRTSGNISVGDITNNQSSASVQTNTLNNDILSRPTQKKFSTISSSGNVLLQPTMNLTNTTLPILSQSNLSIPGINSSTSSSALINVKNNINALGLTSNYNVPLLPQPIMVREKLSNFTCGKFICGIDNSNPLGNFYLLFPSFNLVIQDFFFYDELTHEYNFTSQFVYETAHKEEIENIITANGNETIIIFQGGSISFFYQKHYEIVTTINTQFKNIKIFHVDVTSKFLICIGEDKLNKKDMITIYDIENITPKNTITESKEVPIFLNQISPYDINDIKFNNFVSNNLVSCGYDNIRVWTLKHKFMSGKNVPYSEHVQRNTKFLFVNYDPRCREYFYVVDNKGNLIYANHKTCQIKKVFHIENTLITAFFLNEAYILTGTITGLVHLWYNNNSEGNSSFYIDDSKFILEAKGESAVSAICSFGTESDDNAIYLATEGQISYLDINDKKMLKCVDSNEETIISIATDDSGDFFITVSDEGIMRVWKEFKKIYKYNPKDHVSKPIQERKTITTINKSKQRTKSVSKKKNKTKKKSVKVLDLKKEKPEKPSVIKFIADTDLDFVVGFTNGVLRIFTISSKNVLEIKQEFKISKSKITNISFLKLNTYGLITDEESNIFIVDILNGFMTIKEINNSIENIEILNFSTSKDQNNFAYSTKGNLYGENSVIVYEGDNFGKIATVSIPDGTISSINLFTRNLVCVIFDNSSINFYSLCNSKGMHIKSIYNAHHNHPIDMIDVTQNLQYFFTVSYEEGSVNVWSLKVAYKNFISYQKIRLYPEGIRTLTINDHSGILCCVGMKNQSISFWRIKGEIIFNDRDIKDTLEKIGDKEFVEQLIKKNKTKFFIDFDNEKIYTSKIDNIMDHIQQKRKEYHEKRKKNMPEEEKKEENKEDSDTNLLSNPNKDILDFTTIKKEKEINSKKITKLTQIELYPVSSTNKSFLRENSIEGFYKAHSPTDSVTIVPMLHHQMSGSVEGSDSNRKKIENKIKRKLFLPGTQNYLPERTDQKLPTTIAFSSHSSINLKSSFGSSANSYYNIVMDSKMSFYAHILNNKIIVEILEKERKQIILQDSLDELSCISLSPDDELLLAGVAHRNLGNTAPVLVYSTKTFTLLKKLHFHYTGISQIIPVENNKYLITTGSYLEKTIALWNLESCSFILSKNLKMPVVGVAVDVIYNYSLSDISFNSITQHTLSLWRFKSGQLSSVHFNQMDIEQQPEPGEYFLTIETTPYYEYTKCAYLLVGTNYGNILLLTKDSSDKVFLVKKITFKFDCLNHIFFYNGRKLIISSDRGLVVRYKLQEGMMPNDHMFDFLEKEVENIKCDRITFENGLNALFTKNGDEFICTDDFGSVFFFVDDDEQKVIQPKKVMNFVDEKGFINKIDVNSNGDIISFCDKGRNILIWEKAQSFNISRTITVKPEDFNLTNFFIWKDQSKQREYLLCILAKKTVENDGRITIESIIEVFDMVNKCSVGKIKAFNDEMIENLFFGSSNVFCALSLNNNVFYAKIEEISGISINIEKARIYQAEKLNKIIDVCFNQDNSLIAVSHSDTTISINKVQIKGDDIKVEVVDKFNLLMSEIKSEETSIDQSKQNSRELKVKYNTLDKYNMSVLGKSIFMRTEKDSDILLSISEVLQFIYVRNIEKKIFIKTVSLFNYHPCTLEIPSQYHLLIGTKEGVVILITRSNIKEYVGFTIDFQNGHYDTVRFSRVVQEKGKKCRCITSSYNEINLWEINE